MHDFDCGQLAESWDSYVIEYCDEQSEVMLLMRKASAGFVAFDGYKSLLQDNDGKISGPRTVIAGFGAGVTESLLAVTPFESIKTQLYEHGLTRDYPRKPRLLTSFSIAESTTVSQPTHECAAFFTEVESFSESAESVGSSKDLSRRQRGKQRTLLQDLEVTQLSDSSPKDMWLRGRSSERYQHLRLEEWRG